jgi:hypothetical protein
MRFAIMVFLLPTRPFDGRTSAMDSYLSVSGIAGISGSVRRISTRGRRIAMLEIVVASVIALVLVVGPLVWRVSRDRRESRALSIRAYVQSLVDRKLGGESFVSVQVTPRGLWGRGQVVVAVPGGWEWLLEEAWPVLLARVPRGYELVVRRGESAPDSERQLKRVA